MATESLPKSAYVPQEHYGVSENGRPTRPDLLGDPRYMHDRPANVPPIPGADGKPVTGRYVYTDSKLDGDVLRLYEEMGAKVTRSKEGWYADVEFSPERHSEIQKKIHDDARMQQRSVQASPAGNVKAIPAEVGEVSSSDL